MASSSSSTTTTRVPTPSELLAELTKRRQEPLTHWKAIGPRIGKYVDSSDEKKTYKGINKDIVKAYGGGGTKLKKSSTPLTEDTKLDEGESKANGAVLGKLVDRQLRQAITLMRTNGWSFDKMILKCGGKMHRRSMNILLFIKQQRLIPIACQLSVSCETSRRATDLDMLLWDPATKQYILFEVKCGYNYSNYQIGTVAMYPPFEALMDCEYHRHMIQLLVTLVLFKRTFNVDNVSGLLIRVTNSTVYHYPLERWALDCEASITACFLVRGGLTRQINTIKLLNATTTTDAATTKKSKKSTTKKKSATKRKVAAAASSSKSKKRLFTCQ